MNTREENIKFLKSQADSKKNNFIICTLEGVYFYIGHGAWLNFSIIESATDEQIQTAVNFQKK